MLRRASVCLASVLLAAQLAACGGCGDDGMAMDPDSGPDSSAPPAPQLVSQTPAPGDQNVWQRAPVVLEFDLPLNPDTVTTDAVLLLDDFGEEIEMATIELSADGKTITATYDPLVTPISPVLSVTDHLRGTNGVEVDSTDWGFSLPIWQTVELDADAAAVDVAAGGAVPYVAWIDSGSSAALRVHRAGPSGWRQLGEDLTGDASGGVAITTRGDGSPVVAFTGSGGVQVVQWDGSSWNALGTSLATESEVSDLPAAIAVGTDNAPVVAYELDAAGGVVVRRWDGTQWTQVGSTIATGTAATELALAVRGEMPVVGYTDGAGDLFVTSQSGTATDFDVVTTIDRVSTGAAGLRMVADAGQTYVGWSDGDTVTHTQITAVDPGGDTQALAGSLDLDLAADSRTAAMTLANGTLHAAWSEAKPGGGAELLVARWVGALSPPDGHWQVLGGDATSGALDSMSSAGLAVTSEGDPVVAWADGGVVAARYNASPVAPHGMTIRYAIDTCDIPEEGAGFPMMLSDTGCYNDISSQEPAPELIPYDVRSPLWSDGAAKRRFMVLPGGESIAYTETGAWVMPVGTILVKEFWIESVVGDPASLIPVETRFLVKRCEPGAGCADPWQGYSYQWNTDGTDGTLLPGDSEVTVDWDVDDGGSPATHTHVYPDRGQCLRCHNPNTGYVLGLQTPQLNRPYRYGEVVDGQLRAFDHLGLFGDSFPQTPPAVALPRPPDPAHTYEERSRSYFHANCAQCHRPFGEGATIDFRYDAALAVDNICDKLIPGDSASSTIYDKDSTRPPDTPTSGGAPMPPLGTLLPDTEQLAITAAWIDNMLACP